MKYEVNIIYKGQTNYIIDISDEDSDITGLDKEELAQNVAEDLFKNGEEGVTLGTEYEEIENIVSKPVEE
jgi:hypothetical protein